MGCGCRVRDRTLCITKVGGNGEHTGCIDNLPGILLAAFQLKRNNATKIVLLTFRQFVLGMRGQARVIDPCHLRLLLKPLRQYQCTGRVCLHA